MVTENELDNLLVGQKDRILQFLNEGEYRPVVDSLVVVSHMWAECDYAYKGEEILIRLLRDMPNCVSDKNSETHLRAMNLLYWFSQRVTQRG
jgi:hypothetical protein